ncbi:MAG: hypothetical protein IGNPGNKH_00718 [Sodalis sp. Ffu]|nr:MAG: hypothetical protein IGNPGNKH_00718 [Sodalis sp. Ffu]
MSVSIGLDGVFYRLFTLLQMWTQVDLKIYFCFCGRVLTFVLCFAWINAIFLKVYLLIILSLYVEFLKEVFLNYFLLL